ncbi:MAG: ribosomal protein S18-alanine N-acetyltransferase [Bacilli bacterium]|nr:ribosomal protein S18-alanine N-acetyltransferase [Bacilli bacterium]
MKYLDVEIRPMTDSDLPQVMEIENTSFLHPWKEKDFHYEMHENPVSNVWVIEYSNASLGLKTIVGFVDYWVTFDSGTICQIAVHPDIRRSGVGSELMDEVIKDAKIKKIRTLTLEVRESNEKAIKFYQKYGFNISHVKPSYYSNGENALYMILEVN